MKRIALVLALVVPLAGCTTVAQWTATLATEFSSSTPQQVTTLAEADLAADTLVKLTTVAVDTGKLDKPTLTELQALRAGLRAALDELHAQDAAGKSLDFAAFNAALLAYQSYATTKGISH